MTNRDKLKNMSDEEIAEFILINTDSSFCLSCPAREICINANVISCVASFTKWLKEEAK